MTFNQPLQNNDSINISTEQAQSISSNIVEPKEASWKRNLDIAITIAGAGCLFVLAHSMVMTSSSDRTTPNPITSSQSRILPVETMEVSAVKSYQVSRTYTGKIAAVRNSDLGFSRGGQIESVLVREGDRVTKGQTLAKLDTQNLATQKQQLIAQKAGAQARLAELESGARQEDIDAAQAAIADLEQQLKLQQTQLDRRKFLYSQGAISQESLDEFSFGAGALEARLNQARSNLRRLQNGTRSETVSAQRSVVKELDAQIADLDITIAKSNLKAPFDGIIGERNFDEGTVVNAGQSVISVMENVTPEARIGVPTKLAQQLTVGSSQTLELGSQTYNAQIAAILPQVNLNTRTQTVVFKLGSAEMTQINPGQTVRFQSTENIPSEGYWLPTKAITEGVRGLWTVYILSDAETGEAESYQVQQQAVEIIHHQGDRVLVRGTLQSGDRIIADGIHRLVPGQRVKVASK
ncbi:MAG: efflux RND transporter periplasmic adaptor subunit [Cyanobacteria bacterium P01_G01_bin.67]